MGIAAIVSAVATVGGTVMSYSQQQSAAKEEKRARAAQQRGEEAAAFRERQKAIREARIKRGDMEQGALGTGMGAGTSGLGGGLSALSSELGSNIGYQNVQTGFANMASMHQQKAADKMSSAQTWQSISSVGSTIFDKSGGWDKVGKMFS